MILPLGKTRSRLAFDVPNARAKGRGRTKLGETGQSITPRPLERRVGLPRRGRKPGLHAFCPFLSRHANNQWSLTPLIMTPLIMGFTTETNSDWSPVAFCVPALSSSCLQKMCLLMADDWLTGGHWFR